LCVSLPSTIPLLLLAVSRANSCGIALSACRNFHSNVSLNCHSILPMLQKGLSLLLSATLVACPFVCSLNGVVAKVTGNTTHTCCGCCSTAHAPLGSHAPDGSNHRTPSPGKSCQCICGGAVSQLSATFHVDLDASFPIALPSEIKSPASECELANHVSIAQLQPDDGTNLGRAMRCIFMSFLC